MTAWDLIARDAGCPFLRDEPMRAHTTFRIGGVVPLMLLPENLEQAAALPVLCRDAGVPYVVLGNCSNILVHDEGWQGAVILLKNGLQGITFDGDTVAADSGLILSRVASFAADQGLDGMSWAHGIPGTAGGAVRMNGGAYDGCMQDVVAGVDAADENGAIVHVTAAQCQFAYRHSVFTDNGWMILRVYYKLRPGEPSAIRARIDELTAKRAKSQPLEFYSAGSYFKRPPGHYAAALIDGCGLKGCRVNDAQISQKHAGFLINRGSAAAADVLALERHVKEVVLAQTGVALECEVMKLGFGNEE